MSSSGEYKDEDAVYILDPCPHCDVSSEVTNETGEEPIFCPMCGVDVNEEFSEI